MSTVFNRDYGLFQGRIASGNAFVYELGHADNADAVVKTGDAHEVTQLVTLATDTLFIAPTIRVVTPGIQLSGAQGWEVSAWINTSKLVSRVLRTSKRTIMLNDWRISTTGFSGAVTLRFRLEVVSV